jgi:membrane protein implicated in regulation of membrane protease activity
VSNGNGNGKGGGSGIVALVTALALLIAFAVLFTTFLVVPFFIFLAGIVAMIVSDRKRDPERVAEEKQEAEQAKIGAAEA